MSSSEARELRRWGAVELGRRIACGDVSSQEAVAAYVARIEEVNGSLNAVVVKRYAEAQREAAVADAARRRGETLGPLHGVPFTLKENFHLAGAPSTMGLPTRRDAPLDADGVLVRRMRAAGAIPLGKTNVPQLMIWHECDNPLYGRTNNPWDLERTCGGSTGGEAAIIAAGGSPLGLGGDLGGSIRLPSHFCGIHGIKPTSSRLARAGVETNLRGMETIQFQPGPMARTVEDLETTLRVLAEGEPRASPRLDVTPAPLGESRDVDVTRLTVAFWTDDRFFSPAPAIRRAVREAAEAMRASGAKVVELPPPDVDEAMRLYCGVCAADGGADARRLLAGSPLDWRVARMLRLAGMRRLPRRLLAGYLSWRGQEYFAKLLRFTASRSADEYWRLSREVADYQNRFWEALDASGVDAMIFPPHALPAMQHRKAIDLLAPASYCFLANLLGIPAGVVSLTRVRPDETSDRPVSRDAVILKATQVESGSAGLPVGVQVAARPWREDVALAVMRTLESAFQSRPDYPPRCEPPFLDARSDD